MSGWSGYDFPEDYFIIGKILAIAMLKNVPYGGYLDINMCVAITNYQFTFDFIKKVDEELFKTINYISSAEDVDFDSLALTFSQTYEKNGQQIEVELKEGGRNIAVTS